MSGSTGTGRDQITPREDRRGGGGTARDGGPDDLSPEAAETEGLGRQTGAERGRGAADAATAPDDPARADALLREDPAGTREDDGDAALVDGGA